jgi:hypothetical protein
MKNFFFIDASVVSEYMYQNDHRKHRLKSFFEDPDNTFFFTETTKEELSSRSSIIPKKFVFYHSKLSPQDKEMGIKMLIEIWNKRLSCGEKNYTETSTALNEECIREFRRGLFTIFEASSSCHDAGVLPEDIFLEPSLLTCDTNLLNKFMLKKKTEDILEDTINLCGFEHLLPVISLSSAIDDWADTDP